MWLQYAPLRQFEFPTTIRPAPPTSVTHGWTHEPRRSGLIGLRPEKVTPSPGVVFGDRPWWKLEEWVPTKRGSLHSSSSRSASLSLPSDHFTRRKPDS